MSAGSSIFADPQAAAQALQEHQKRSAQIAQAVAPLGVQPDDLQTISLNVINVYSPMLPALSREFLKRSLAKEEPKEAKVTIENGDFAYAWA